MTALEKELKPSNAPTVSARASHGAISHSQAEDAQTIPAEGKDKDAEGESAVAAIVHKVVGATRAVRLLQWPVSRANAAQSEAQDEAGDEAPSIASAMNFRGVRQGRLWRAVREGARDVEATDKRGRTALHYAADAAEMDVLIRLLQSGANVNAKDEKGTTQLHLAVEDVEATRLLLQNGADVTAQNGEGLTALDCAVKAKASATKHLLRLWSDIARGHTSANEALRAGFGASDRYRARDITEAIAAGADDLSLTDSKGRNALHWAAREADLDGIERLLEAGADPKTLDGEGNTPAVLARIVGKSGAEEVVQMLVEWEKRAG